MPHHLLLRGMTQVFWLFMIVKYAHFSILLLSHLYNNTLSLTHAKLCPYKLLTCFRITDPNRCNAFTVNLTMYSSLSFTVSLSTCWLSDHLFMSSRLPQARQRQLWCWWWVVWCVCLCASSNSWLHHWQMCTTRAMYWYIAKLYSYV